MVHIADIWLRTYRAFNSAPSNDTLYLAHTKVILLSTLYNPISVILYIVSAVMSL